MSLRCLGEILGRSLDTVRRYVRRWQDQAPEVLRQLVQWVLEVRPDFPPEPITPPPGVRPGGEHLLELAAWAERLEGMRVPETAQQSLAKDWSAVNLLLQGIPHWL